MADETSKPPTIAVETRTEFGGVLVQIKHPEGVECDFTSGQCSCGRLELGIVRDDTGSNDLDGLAEQWVATIRDAQ